MAEFKRYGKFEDNGDGTMTLTFCVEEGVELQALAAISFDDVLNGMTDVVDLSTPESQALMDKVHFIPDNIESL